ncbi:MAG: hypothetical protein K0R73_1058 [Candidatus Midichloriaceae bacterium]|jgi:hypothetical protein|nr:hypothetical protein [Candidatus Midichloriaceae bacterium]
MQEALMKNDDSEFKNLLLRVRISKPEREHLKALANQSSVSVSDYVRCRLFDENLPDITEDEVVSRFNCDHDKEVMRVLIRILSLIKSLAKQSLPKADYEAAYAMALLTK